MVVVDFSKVVDVDAVIDDFDVDVDVLCVDVTIFPVVDIFIASLAQIYAHLDVISQYKPI